ncbi:MAG: hypothetical protein HEEMFOPI_00399 [Holosporales bacterium]
MIESFDVQQFLDKKHNGLLLANQTALEQKLAVIADNLTKSTLPGGKEGKINFKEYIQKTTDGEKLSFVMIKNIEYDQTQGGIKYTGSIADFAINGDGYFKLKDGYTRNGQFVLSPEGTLMTSNGIPVLSEDGDSITFPSDKKNIAINSEGIISADGEIISKIGVVHFKDPQKFKHKGNSFFTTTESPEPFKGSIIHKSLESSNVSAINQIVELTKTQRNFDSTQKMIDEMEKLSERTVNVSANNK